MATLNATQIGTLVRKHWTVADDATVTVAIAIALAESGGRTDALNTGNRNGSKDWGLFQINDVNWTAKDTAATRYDPDTNTAKAYEVYKRQGLKAWTVYKTGAYERHMAAARSAVSTRGVGGTGGTTGTGSDKAVSEAGSKVSTSSGIELPSIPTVQDVLGGAFADFQATLMKILNSALLWIIAALFLILGVVIVLRRQVGAAASLATPGGAVGKVVGAAAAASKVAKG